jgi:hypothetical protein
MNKDFPSEFNPESALLAGLESNNRTMLPDLRVVVEMACRPRSVVQQLIGRDHECRRHSPTDMTAKPTSSKPQVMFVRLFKSAKLKSDLIVRMIMRAIRCEADLTCERRAITIR